MPYVAVCAKSLFLLYWIEHELVAAALKMLYIQRFVRSMSAQLHHNLKYHTDLRNLHFVGWLQKRKGIIGTSKFGHHEFAEMERMKSIANGTKGNVARCPMLKLTKPIHVTEAHRDHRRIFKIRIGQWQYIGSNFPSNYPLHLFGQRHGVSCVSLNNKTYIPMGLVWTIKYKTTPLCQIWNLPCNVCNMNPLLHTRTHVR